MKEFCHLHVHDEYSVLDGFGTCEMYVSRAKELNFKYLALTNHGNIDGLIKFQKCCIENNIKPILGSELYIVKDITKKLEKKEKSRNGHIVVLVKNTDGWMNLTKLLTIANLEGFYYRPRVDFNSFLKHCGGLVILTACASSFLNLDDGEDFLKELIKNNCDIYGEIMPIDYNEQVEHNKKIVQISKQYNIPLVATNDCHYPRNDDSKAQEILLAMQQKAKWDDKNRWKFSTTGLYLKSYEEMLQSFKTLHSYLDDKVVHEAIINSIEIAKSCDFVLEKSKIFVQMKANTEQIHKHIKNLCLENMNNKIVKKGLNSLEYRKRLKHELDIIKSLGFSSYFLIIADIIKWCKENKIFVGYGRGSVSGSLVAYLLGITLVDPIVHKLMFERFISSDRVDLPDIDVDFEDVRRNDVRDYIVSKYGQYNVANVSTFLQMRSKMVFRDICRVFDIPLNIVNKISKYIEDIKEAQYEASERIDNTVINLKNIFETNYECINFKKQYPHIVDYCLKLVGQIRGIGKHAAAIIVTNDDLRESGKCNLTKRNSVLTINWDKKDCEFMGLLKLDVLGLSNLSIMHRVYDLVKANRGIEIDFENIDLCDKKVLNEFALGYCIGVFQFNTYGLRKLCHEMKVDSFELLTHLTAVYRPSNLRSGFIDEFKERRFENYAPNNIYDKFLKNTYGTIIYQEQVMQIIHELAGLSFSDADIIRKLLNDENHYAINKYRRAFVLGCLERDINNKLAIYMWNDLKQHGGYSFNLAHACGYTMLSFANMYCKVYYPAEFLCAHLTFIPNIKKMEMINEAERLGFRVITPKIGLSKATDWHCVGKNIYMPFIEIKGIGPVFADKLNQINKNNKGFFDNGLSGKLKSILEQVNAYDINKNCDMSLMTFISETNNQ